jgi:pyruvate dehydrogenase E2 component (dihydrolipoyllysine-residue acetyltransferase)
MVPIIMPQVGQDIATGKIVEWLKKENEPVAKDEIILVVQSEKASFEVEAEVSGILLKILHGEDEEVEILQPVAYIGQPGETFDPAQAKADAVDTVAPASAAVSEAVTVEPAPLAEPADEAGRPVASPSVRRIARERGIDLARVAGSGPGGRIIKRDVLAADAGPGVAIDEGDTVVPFSRLRKRVADRLTESKQRIPHFYVMIDVDITAALDWRRRFNGEHEAHLTVTDLIVKATADALRRHPTLNAHGDAEKVVLKNRVNIGIAVSVEEGLLVPVIPDTDRKSLPEISALSRSNAEDTRRGMVDPRIVGTFTVSTLGMHGVRQFLPIINPPECAILAVGAAQPRVVSVSGGFEERQVMTLTLACDHRAVDGVAAAALLNEIKAALETIAETASAWL